MARRTDRLNKLLAHIDATQTGIEVAPYFNPALPKSGGNSVLILDVFDTETLRNFALNDPNIPNERISEIEVVDLVGDAGNIAQMVADKGMTGNISFIVSSHNFEHLSNPIKFLQGCSDALKPGGVLSMAVPDARTCFDIFRMPTKLIDWISAFHSDRSQPSPETLFDGSANLAVYTDDGQQSAGVGLEMADPAKFELAANLRDCYATYLERLNEPGEYKDAHCTVMTPETLILLLRDSKHLGLIDFEIIEVSKTHGHEFFIHLRKPLSATEPQDDASYQKQRHAMMCEVNYSLGALGYKKNQTRASVQIAIRRAKLGLKNLVGANFYNKVRAANRARRDRNRARD